LSITDELDQSPAPHLRRAPAANDLPGVTEIRVHDLVEPDPPRTDGDPAVGGSRTGESDPNAPAHTTIIVRDDPAGTVVAVSGELDLLSAPRLRTELESVLRAQPRHLAVDLTQTTFMDSAGVHTLLDACDHAGGHLAVICGEGPVRQVIELLGLVQLLNVVPSLEEYRARRAGA
jgi:anti-sigma B factor antagonist